MVAIIDNVTFEHDDVEAITNAAEEIKGDIQDLITQVPSTCHSY